MKTSAHSLEKATRLIRGYLGKTYREDGGELACLYRKDSKDGLNILWLKEILVAAEAQLAALKSLKESERDR